MAKLRPTRAELAERCNAAESALRSMTDVCKQARDVLKGFGIYYAVQERCEAEIVRAESLLAPPPVASEPKEFPFPGEMMTAGDARPGDEMYVNGRLVMIAGATVAGAGFVALTYPLSEYVNSTLRMRTDSPLMLVRQAD